MPDQSARSRKHAVGPAANQMERASGHSSLSAMVSRADLNHFRLQFTNSHGRISPGLRISPGPAMIVSGVNSTGDSAASSINAATAQPQSQSSQWSCNSSGRIFSSSTVSPQPSVLAKHSAATCLAATCSAQTCSANIRCVSDFEPNSDMHLR